MIKRLNHLVLFVRSAKVSAGFYGGVLGFKVREQIGENAIFMVAAGSDNHHDLGLFSVGDHAQPLYSGPRVGMYHAAWEVEEITDLPEIRDKLIAADAFVGESDHGVSLSLYGQDPDGNEFEAFWMMPKEEWDKRPGGVHQLHLEEEIKRRTS